MTDSMSNYTFTIGGTHPPLSLSFPPGYTLSIPRKPVVMLPTPWPKMIDTGARQQVVSSTTEPTSTTFQPDGGAHAITSTHSSESLQVKLTQGVTDSPDNLPFHSFIKSDAMLQHSSMAPSGSPSTSDEIFASNLPPSTLVTNLIVPSSFGSDSRQESAARLSRSGSVNKTNALLAIVYIIFSAVSSMVI
ncbi:hypothetical protein NLJ89_g2819 [Agrocybe chaxingu]|uniref:Uncharacterized protein n=1 Tax=Agrocybe chaxingu TaxID=84603 RepID=A0A9W8MXD8_9AGAR|nr:hypothetical protein NLJ89_g2819 [Agrocybe chaxingu]